MTPRKILVLDDEEHFAEMLKSVLEQHFFLVDSATRPEEALMMIEETGYGLVVSDYKMPAMDGAEFLERARDKDPDLPVILVSGLMNTPDLLKVANMGVTLVFEKPIVVSTFIEAVSRFVKPMSADMFSDAQAPSADTETEDDQRVVRGYPVPPAHVSDASPRMIQFMQGLWMAFREQSHIFLSIPGGSEVELILREVTRWHHSAERDLLVLRVNAHDTGFVDEQLEELVKWDNLSRIIGVVGYESATIDQQEALVQRLADADPSLTFLHFIRSRQIDEEPETLHSEIRELLREGLLVLPPLRKRLADLVAYVQRYLPLIAAREGRSSVGIIQSSAMQVLFNFRWPGNFSQLLDVLRRAVLLSNGMQPLDAQDLLKAMARIGATPYQGERFALEDLLRQHQRRLLQKNLSNHGNNIGELLHAAKVPSEIIQKAETIDGLSLVFADLLKA